MNAEEMKLLTTMARIPCKGILKEIKQTVGVEICNYLIKQRALDGYYSYALWDALDPDTVVQLKKLGYDVDVGTKNDISWFIITWGEQK